MNLPDNLQPLVKAIRPKNDLLPLLITSIVILSYTAPLYLLLLCAIIIFSVYGFVTIHNDLTDQHIDRENNRRDIALANKEVTERSLLHLAIGLLLLSVIVALLTHISTLLWISAYLLFGWLYSGPANLKSKGIWAVTILAFCYTTLPFILGLLVADEPILTIQNLFFSLALFIYTVGIINLKDYKDLLGDKRHGKYTLLVKYGPKFIYNFILITSVIAYIILIYYLFSVGLIWISLSVFFISVAYISLIKRTFSTIEKPKLHLAMKLRTTFVLIWCVCYYSVVNL